MSCFARIVRGLAAAVLTAVGVAPAAAQAPSADPPSLPDVNEFLKQQQVAPAGFGRQATNPCTTGCPPAQCWPCPGYTPGCPGVPCTPSPVPGMPPPGSYNPPTGTGSELSSTAPTSETPDFGDRGRGAGAGPTVGVGGYLDNPVPITTFRLQYESAYNINRPDRSEFIWAAWKELGFHPHGINGQGAFFDPSAKGPEFIFSHLDYQDISPYFELAITKRFSAFVEIPVRFIHTSGLLEDPDNERMPNGQFFPEPRPPGGENHEDLPFNGINNGGLADMNAGFKYAFIANPNRYLTFQFRTYIPTGDPGQGLGTGHVSLEPGLLYYQRLTDRVTFQSEFRDWIPIGGARSIIDGRRFDGNILIYGLGVGYDIYRSRNWVVTPVGEVVGWTVLGGLASVAAGAITATPPPGVFLPQGHGVEDASGNTIVDLKFGVRTTFCDRHSVYAGYGFAVTGNRWYQDIIRVEYRFLY